MESLESAREAVCLETGRFFFESFVESAGGQAFVLHVVGDGTLETTKVWERIKQDALLQYLFPPVFPLIYAVCDCIPVYPYGNDCFTLRADERWIVV